MVINIVDPDYACRALDRKYMNYYYVEAYVILSLQAMQFSWEYPLLFNFHSAPPLAFLCN